MAERLLRLRQVAQDLDIPLDRCHRMVRAGVLPSCRIGARSIRVPESALAAWIRDRTTGAAVAAESHG